MLVSLLFDFSSQKFYNDVLSDSVYWCCDRRSSFSTYSLPVIILNNLLNISFSSVVRPSAVPPSLFRLAGSIPAGALARRPKFGWRRHQTFPMAEFGERSGTQA